MVTELIQAAPPRARRPRAPGTQSHYGQQRGSANLDIFAEGSVMEPGNQGIYTMPDSPVKSLAQLKNHTIAINAPKNILYLLAASVLAEQWAAANPHTLAAFYKALEQGQQIADTSRAAVEAAMEDVPAPFGVSKTTAAIMALDNYPVSTGPVGSVDKVRLQRVVDVMQQFIGFPSFNISSMLMGGS